MQCPRCTTTELREVDRDAVTIDRCDRCRGIWLDRGELEKLMARDHRDNRNDRDRGGRNDRDDDDDDDDRGGRRRGSIWDIFD